jgi:hypothetical protein
MVHWKPLLFVVLLCNFANSEPLRIQTDGPHGPDGNQGVDGSNAWSAGARGGDAGNGTPGGHGKSAGNIFLRLKKLDGKFQASGTADERPFSSQHGITSPIDLSARGGNGGAGGRGGDAGNGAKGTRGRDASPGVDGTAGGRGGNGGDGGNGREGGDAGDGGEVLVVAPYEDIALFALINGVPISAGTPGSGGRAGSGGSPGPGGDGGSALTWYTTETRTVTRTRQVPHQGSRSVNRTRRHPDGSTEMYTDNENYTEYTTESYQATESYQQPHHQSSGAQGWAGSSGSSGVAGRPGNPGRNGSFAFVIDHGNGIQKRYQRLFNLSLDPYKVVDRTGDGVFEPGESGYVEAMVVRNSGGMPTPPTSHSSTRVFLKPDAWHTPESKIFELPHNLEPGQPHSFDGQLGFRIRDVEGPERGKPWSSSFTVRPDAELLPVERRFSDFNRPVNVPVRFPVAFRLDGPPSLAQGEQGRVRLHVTNISQSTLGGGDALDRMVSLFLKERVAAGSGFSLAVGNTKKELKQGLTLPVESLAPGETRTIEGIVSVPADYPAQSAFSFDTTLNIGKIEDPKIPRPIQEAGHRISIASKYHTDLSADIALVINSETTTEEIGAWQQLLENKLGFRMVTWNATYYGNFDLDREFVDDPRWHLLRDFKGKTVIVLNNSFRSYFGVETTAMQLLSHQSFVKAVGEYGVSFMVVSPSGDAESVFPDLLRSKPGEGSRVYASTDDLIRGLDIAHRDRLGANLRAPMGPDIHSVAIVENRFSSATESALQARAELLDRQLRLLWPQRRYCVIYDFKGEVLRPGTISRSKVYLGDLWVQRLTDTGDSMGVAVRSAQMQSPEFIASPANEAGLFSSLPPTKLLSLFHRVLEQLAEKEDKNLQSTGTLLVDEILRAVRVDYQASQKGDTRRGSASPRVLAKLRNWRVGIPLRSGSGADQLVRRLYSRVLSAGYYAYGHNRVVADSAQADTEFWAKQLYPERSQWKAFKESGERERDELLARAKVAYWSYDSTNYGKVHETLSQQTESERRTYLDPARDVPRVMAMAELLRSAQQSEQRDQRVKQRSKADLEARRDLKLNPPVQAEVDASTEF